MRASGCILLFLVLTVSDTLGPILRPLKLGTRKDRTDGDRIERSLQDLLAGLRRAGGPVEREVDDATKYLLDALNNLRKRQEAGGSPSKDDLEEFQKALGNLKKLLTGIVPKKEDKEQLASEQFKDSLNLIKKAAKDGDTDKVPLHLRNAVAVCLICISLFI
jgi:hypothetical protein